jgi:hypothetical protein
MIGTHAPARRQAQTGAARGQPVAADGLLHPAVLLAIVALILNDHVLKAAWPGLVTGKLSDVAGLAFFPVLLVAGWELARTGLGGWAGPSRRALVVAVAGTGVVFGLAKTSSLGRDAVAWGLGALQWLVAEPVALLRGGQADLRPVVIVQDPGDLIALAALAIALWAGVSRTREAGR